MMMRPYVPKRDNSWGTAGVAVVPAVAAGIFLSSIHQIFVNTALMGQLSLAIPIMSAAPVFVMILSAIFLRDLERLNQRVVIGILITAAGMVAIGAGRHG
jgi:drug/metabolite transporter (DMT)-like permease